MTKQHRYYRGELEITAAEALDSHGIMRDGVAIRVGMRARDHKLTPWADAKFDDGGDPTSGNRPGWRIPLHDDKRRAVVADAYRDYETRLVPSARLPILEKT